jgi:hypothetical protein
MRNPVEAGAYIPLQDPLGAVVFAKRDKAGFNRVCGRAGRPEPVGVRVSSRLGNRVQGQQVQSLHRSVSHGRDGEGPLSAIALWNVDTSQRLRTVSSLPERVHRRYLLFWRGPGFPIDARSSFASVFCHSPHRKSLAAERVGEQVLQRFHFAPLARLSCLRDTGLEPTNVALGLTPVDLMPCQRLVGGCTNRGIWG